MIPFFQLTRSSVQAALRSKALIAAQFFPAIIFLPISQFPAPIANPFQWRLMSLSAGLQITAMISVLTLAHWYPLHFDGSKGPFSSAARRLANILGAWIPLAIFQALILGAASLVPPLVHSHSGTPTSVPAATPPYWSLWLLSASYLLLMLGWAQFLTTIVPGVPALLLTMLVTLSASVLSSPTHEDSATQFLQRILPNLNTIQISNEKIVTPLEPWRLLYAALHASWLGLMSALVDELRRSPVRAR